MFKKIFCIGIILLMITGSAFGCKNENEMKGEFYSLRDAYEKGFLSKDDLRSIAYYHNAGTTGDEEVIAEDFVPTPKNPEVLSIRIEKAIIETELNITRTVINDASTEGIIISAYYGNYGDVIAVAIRNSYRTYAQGVVAEYNIGDVIFYNYSSPGISIWKEIK